MPHVLLVGQIHERGVARLALGRGLTHETLADPSPAEILARMPEVDAVLVRTARITGEMIAASPRLKVVSRHGVGYDNVDLAALNARRIPLMVAGTANSISVAEHAIFLMLACAKQGMVFDRAVRENRWSARDRFGAIELYGRTLLLIGFGRIGREVTVRAKGFGMRVVVFDPFVDAATAEAAGATLAPDLHAALAEADVVSIHAPRSPATEGLIGKDALGRMKPEAILVNTARGGIIDEGALFEALKAHRIRAAGLDVFDQEPPPAGHPLYALDNVVLTPHSAGVTGEAMIRMAEVSADNVVAALAGRPDPSMVVNREVLG